MPDTVTPAAVETGAPRRVATIEAFKAFDAAAARVAAMPDPEDFESSMRVLRELIDELPQRAAIKTENADRWLQRTMEAAVARMELEHGEAATVGDVHRHVFWHIRRASAFGGSEVATLVKHLRGERGGFSDARSLIMEKLLIRSPMPSTPEMSRGIRAEPWVQKIFQEKSGCQTSEKLVAKLRGFRWEKRPEMVGTPDDIVLTPEGRVRLVDYKAPSADVCSDYEKNGISFDYVCQVHHYGVLAMAAGSKFDEMSLEVFDPRHFDVASFPIEFDMDLAKTIVGACKHFWHDFVMQGELPEKLASPDLNLEDPEIVKLGFQLAMFKVLGKDLEDKAKDIQGRISALGGDWHGLSAGKLDLDIAAFERKRKWDEDLLLSIAASADIDTSAFVKSTGKPDNALLASFADELRGMAGNDPEVVAAFVAERVSGDALMSMKLDADGLAAHLEEQGQDVTAAKQIAESFSLTRKKKGPEVERLSALKDKMSELSEGIGDTIWDNIDDLRIVGTPEGVEAERIARLAEMQPDM